MTTSTHWLRPPFRRAGEPVRHTIKAGASFTLCGKIGYEKLGGESFLKPDCPACAKALEGGQ